VINQKKTVKGYRNLKGGEGGEEDPEEKKESGVPPPPPPSQAKTAGPIEVKKRRPIEDIVANQKKSSQSIISGVNSLIETNKELNKQLQELTEEKKKIRSGN